MVGRGGLGAAGEGCWHKTAQNAVDMKNIQRPTASSGCDRMENHEWGIALDVYCTSLHCSYILRAVQ